MNATLWEAIEEAYPEVAKHWDGHDYRVHAPLSLDDAPVVHVHLKNKNKSEVVLKLSVGQKGGSENGSSVSKGASDVTGPRIVRT